MVKVMAGAKIEKKIKDAATKDATKRGMTLSRYIENALIREINRKGNKNSVYELERLRDDIEERIKELTVEKDSEFEDILTHEEEIELYVEQVQKLQNSMGRVTDGVIKRYSSQAGISYIEFLGILKEKGIKVTIMD